MSRRSGWPTCWPSSPKETRLLPTGASMTTRSARLPSGQVSEGSTGWCRLGKLSRSTRLGMASISSTTWFGACASAGRRGTRRSDRGLMTLRVAAPAFASAEALPEIVAFMERVVPRERPWGPDLAWQYLSNPSGVARYVNAYDDSARLIAHYAVLPTPPLAEFAGLLAGTYLSLNVAADPAATIPGLMIATTRALYRQLQAAGPVVVVGVTTENS